MICGVLIGNSSLRVATFSEAGSIEASYFDWKPGSAFQFEALREFVLASGSDEVVLASVREDRREALIEALASEVRVATIGLDLTLPIENRCQPAGEVGVDRLLNAIAARDLWPGQHVAAIDFGTALSVSVVAADGAFIGGVIGVGARASFRGLQADTPVLPAAEMQAGGVLQTNTVDAMGTGVYLQQLGGARLIIERLRAEVLPSLRIVVTGRGAEVYLSELDGVDRRDPHLTLRGLSIAHRCQGKI